MVREKKREKKKNVGGQEKNRQGTEVRKKEGEEKNERAGKDPLDLLPQNQISCYTLAKNPCSYKLHTP